MARRRNQAPVGTRSFTPWDPSRGNNTMSYEEFAARHPGIRSEAVMRDKYEASTNATGGNRFMNRMEGDVVDDIAAGRVRIIPEAVQGARPDTPPDPGLLQPGPGDIDPERQAALRDLLGQIPPDSPLQRRPRGGAGDDELTKAPTAPKMLYKDFLNGMGSTAARAGEFRRSQGMKLTPKMRRAMQSGAGAKDDLVVGPRGAKLAPKWTKAQRKRARTEE